jgi:diguanylate cyclase (GGDEF)-like protein/PAS domain S-box-containing protein
MSMGAPNAILAEPSVDLDVQVQSHRLLKPWVALFCVWCLIAMALGLHLLSQREKVGSLERERLHNAAKVIEETLTRQLRGAAAALAGVRYDISQADSNPGQSFAPLRLKVLRDAMPGVRSMVIINSKGVVVGADRKDLVGRDFSDSRSFRVPAAERDPAKLYVSSPFKSPLSGTTISLGKVVRDGSGAFAGVVFATLDPEYFDRLMASVLYAPDMASGIAHGDGKVVVVMPTDPMLLALDVATVGSVFSQHKESGLAAALYEGKGSIAKALEDRLTAARTMQPAELVMDTPLVITVSRLRKEVYAAWFIELIVTVAVATSACISSALALLVIQRRYKALAAIRKAGRRLAEESAQRVRLALEGADLGLWDWNTEMGLITINSREATLLGFDAGTTEYPVKVWQHLIHPEDWPEVRRKFLELTDGQCDSFKIEHRMLHQRGAPVWVFSQATVIERSSTGQVLRILGTHLDISARKRSEAQLNETLSRLELAIKCGSVGLVDWNVATGALVLNKLAREMVGIEDNEEVTATSWRARRHPDDVPKVEEALRMLSAGTSDDNQVECRIRHARGDFVWLHMQAVVVERATNGDPVRVMLTYRDVSTRIAADEKMQMLNEQLAQLSITDALTGVANRRRFDDVLTSEWARNMRSRQEMALLMIDIDHFKLYNDHYGHLQGDRCLQAVAEILSQCARRPDELLVRYGGEEFAVLLYAGTRNEALELAQRCVIAINAAAIPHAASPVAAHVTLSIGVQSMTPQPGDRSEILIKRADEALYHAKSRGRARAESCPHSAKTPEPVLG